MAWAQNAGLHPFTLTGTIKGLDSGYVYLNYIPNGAMGIVNSSTVRNGHFMYQGTVTEPTKAWFSAQRFDMPDEKNLTQFYIEPGDLRLNATYNHLKSLELTGSASDSDRTRLEKMEEPVNQEINSLEDVYRKYDAEYKLAKKNNPDSIRLRLLIQKRDSINTVLENLNRDIAHLDSIFIIENPDSYVAADLLSRSGVSWIAFPSLDSLYAKFPDYIQRSFPGKKIKLDIDRDKVVAIGGNAKPFIAKDSKGDTIQLSDYKGKKYVLLDFGASWCAPCRAIIPDLKKYYAKYNAALEMISIANQEEESDWCRAIEEDQVEWPQIIENKNLKPIEPADSSISDLYYVSGIPSVILLDKNLKIIGRYGGFYYAKTDYMPDLEKKLADLFHR